VAKHFLAFPSKRTAVEPWVLPGALTNARNVPRSHVSAILLLLLFSGSVYGFFFFPPQVVFLLSFEEKKKVPSRKNMLWFE